MPLAYGKAELDEAFHVVAVRLGLGDQYETGHVPPMRAGDFRAHVRAGKAWLSANEIVAPAIERHVDFPCSTDLIGEE